MKELQPEKVSLSPVLLAVLDNRVTVRCVSLTAHVRVSSGHAAGYRIALRKHKLQRCSINLVLTSYVLFFNLMHLSHNKKVIHKDSLTPGVPELFFRSGMSALLGLLALPSMGLGGPMPRLPDELDLRAGALPSSLCSLSAEVV